MICTLPVVDYRLESSGHDYVNISNPDRSVNCSDKKLTSKIVWIPSACGTTSN